MNQGPQICDYEGSAYRTDFWEGKGRQYEDQVERAVLRDLLPQSGRRLLEIGAGFGRLTNEYSMFDHVVLVDYSFSQLQYARQQYGDDGFTYVAADAYRLPFRPGVFDAATMIRVIHHIADVDAMLSGVRRVLAPEATFILEHANKRNIKAMLRYALRWQEWSPYSRKPVEFVALNYDFHPAYIRDHLAKTGFKTYRRVPVSFLRLGLLKRTLPTDMLVTVDRLLGKTGALVSPSVFTANRALGETHDHLDYAPDDIFACPRTGMPLEREGDALVNIAADSRYEVRDGIYIFKDLDE